jgi:hypothetical protein
MKDEMCLLLGFHAAYIGRLLPKFRYNLSFLSSRVEQVLDRITHENGTENSPETSVTNYLSTLREISQERI